MFERYPAGSVNPATGENRGLTFVPGSPQATNLNYAKLKVRGIDLEAAYRTQVGSGTLNTRLTLTKVLGNNQFLLPDQPNFADHVMSELGDPEWSWNLSLDYDLGKLAFNYQLRYIGKQVVNFAEDVYSVNGAPPQNADWAEILFYPDVFYHDIRASYDFSDSINAYIGADNLFNRTPPLGATGVGAGSGIFDNRGRFFYAGATLKF